jgi:hypothetical protein
VNEREQIINFLLQQCDAKNRMLEEFQKQITALQKEITENQGKKETQQN